MAIDVDSIQSRSVPASNITSSQNSSQSLISLLFSPLICRTRRKWSRFLGISSHRIFQHHFFRICFFFHMNWRCWHLFKHPYMLPCWCSTFQESPWSLFSSLLTMINLYILQRFAIHGTMVLIEGSPSRSLNRTAIVELRLIPDVEKRQEFINYWKTNY